jgi:UTP--glucose-1-phosphate uridylyltransferase
MTRTLADELDALPSSLARMLQHHHFDRDWFMDRAEMLRSGRVVSNRVGGTVAPPTDGDVVDLPDPSSERGQELARAGLELLSEGQAALIVLAGGMATRMGGVVKALLDALPGKQFLDLRLAEQRASERRSGKRPPVWLMTSHSTDEKIRDALGDRADGYHLATFPQYLSLRLTPEGTLFRDANGAPSEHAPGHGDLPDALKHSGLLERFVASGGKVVTVANLDNLGATLDPLLLGWHAAHGAPVTCEVVDKVGSDRGGIPVRWNDRPVVLEEFRLPEGFDASVVRVFSTNTFHFDARALSSLDMQFTYFTVRKRVNGRDAIQLERLVGEVTSNLDTRYARVPRSGAHSRFLPVKDNDELARRRPEIETVARARGMLG